MSRLTLAVAVAGAAAGITWLATLSSGRQVSQPGEQHQALIERLERLEAGGPGIKRTLTQAGAQMGVAVLGAAAASGPAAAGEEDGTVAGEVRAKEREAERVARESRHYDRLDELARIGGGAAEAARLRSNIEKARSQKANGSAADVDLDIAKLECSDALCRVELRIKGPVGPAALAGARVLAPGMGTLSMRPHSPGTPAVYYLAPPGQQLPRFDP